MIDYEIERKIEGNDWSVITHVTDSEPTQIGS